MVTMTTPMLVSVARLMSTPRDIMPSAMTPAKFVAAAAEPR